MRVTRVVEVTGGRWAATDALRGLATLAAVVVNGQPRDGGYAALRHPSWFGFSAADVVFPALLFAAGVAVPHAADTAAGTATRTVTRLAYGSGGGASALLVQTTVREADPSVRLRAALLRAARLFAVGLAMNALGTVTETALEGGDVVEAAKRTRVMGVLQRHSLCYAVAVLLHTKFHARATPIAMLVLVLAWARLSHRLPGSHQAANLHPPFETNAYRLDRFLKLTGRRQFEPEGALSKLPYVFFMLIHPNT